MSGYISIPTNSSPSYRRLRSNRSNRSKSDERITLFFLVLLGIAVFVFFFLGIFGVFSKKNSTPEDPYDDIDTSLDNSTCEDLTNPENVGAWSTMFINTEAGCPDIEVSVPSVPVLIQMNPPILMVDGTYEGANVTLIYEYCNQLIDGNINGTDLITYLLDHCAEQTSPSRRLLSLGLERYEGPALFETAPYQRHLLSTTIDPTFAHVGWIYRAAFRPVDRTLAQEYALRQALAQLISRLEVTLRVNTNRIRGRDCNSRLHKNRQKCISSCQTGTCEPVDTRRGQKWQCIPPIDINATNEAVCNAVCPYECDPVNSTSNTWDCNWPDDVDCKLILEDEHLVRYECECGIGYKPIGEIMPPEDCGEDDDGDDDHESWWRHNWQGEGVGHCRRKAGRGYGHGDEDEECECNVRKHIRGHFNRHRHHWNGNGYGHCDHGNGNGYGHDDEECNPLPTCMDCNECNATEVELNPNCTLNRCDPINGQCINTVGSYTCQCNEGYTGDGFICTNTTGCLPGFYEDSFTDPETNETQVDCIACPINTASNVTGATSNATCLPCHIIPGFPTLPGSAECVIIGDCNNTCAQNATCIDYGSTVPAFCLCNPGFFGNPTVACYPDDCECGEKIGTAGSCVTCDAGRFNNIGPADVSPDAFVCYDCDPGQFSNAGACKCTDCPAGSISNASGAAFCDPCPDGTYIPFDARAECFICPAGQQGTGDGAIACEPCPPGSVSNETGTPSGECIVCSPGFFSDVAGQTDCESCLAGTFSAASGSIECEVCPAGSVQPDIEQGSCNPCAAGFFMPVEGQAFCIPCRSGTYQNETGATECTLCPAGTYNPLSGQTDVAACLPCAAGTFSAFAGSAVCPACSAGTFQDETGQTSCDPCAAGSFTSIVGQTGCSDCAPGFFQPDTGSTSCDLCSAIGSYQPNSGAEECLTCPTGTIPNGPPPVACVCLGSGYCDPAATCVDQSAVLPTCECNTGYSGDGFTCADCDECAGSNACNLTDNCAAEATCTNTPGSFTCACNSCYEGDGETCSAADSCASNPCDPNADCTNTLTGSCFTCECHAGYWGNGTTCEDCDECAIQDDPGSNPSMSQCGAATCDAVVGICTNTPGSFECACPFTIQTQPIVVQMWYNDTFGDGTQCDDIDECVVGFPAPYGCDANSVCNNTIGGAECICSSGFQGDGFICPNFTIGSGCEDINECNITDDCATNATCFNLNGTFSCVCNEGTQGNGTECTDCPVGYYNPFSAQQNQFNMTTPSCEPCAPGFFQNVTGQTFCYACAGGYGSGMGATSCSDCDECNATQVATLGGCVVNDCNENATCTNTAGSFECDCDVCFEGSGQVCTDVDECTAGTDNCHPNATCTNQLAPSCFSCACDTCFKGNGLTCEDADECAGDNGGHNCFVSAEVNATCTNDLFPTCFTCACPEDYYGDGVNCTACPAGTFTNGASGVVNASGCQQCNECSGECGGHNCDVNAVCNELDFGFNCSCKSCFEGNGTVCVNPDDCATNPCHPNATCFNDDIAAQCFGCKCNYPVFKGDGFNCTYRTCAELNYERPPGFGDSGCLYPNSTLTSPYCCVDADILGEDAPTCECTPGRELNLTSGECDDIDECATLTNPCGTVEVVVNNVTTVVTLECENLDYFITFNDEFPYRCKCPAGYESIYLDVDINAPCKFNPIPSSTFCVDEDECLDGVLTGNCTDSGGTCVNIAGGWNCVCPNNTALNPLTGECELTGCPPGYFLNTTANECQDIDECAFSTAVCEGYRLNTEFECVPRGGLITHTVSLNHIMAIHCNQSSGAFCARYVNFIAGLCGVDTSFLPCTYNEDFTEVSCTLSGVCALNSNLFGGGFDQLECVPGDGSTTDCTQTNYGSTNTKFVPYPFTFNCFDDGKFSHLNTDTTFSCPNFGPGPHSASINALLTEMHCPLDGTVCQYSQDQTNFEQCTEDVTCGTGNCVNTPGSFTCECLEGTTLNTLTGRCEDETSCLSDRPCPLDCLCEDRCGATVCGSLCDLNPCATLQDCAESDVSPFFECSCSSSGEFCGEGKLCTEVVLDDTETQCVTFNNLPDFEAEAQALCGGTTLPLGEIIGLPSTLVGCCGANQIPLFDLYDGSIALFAPPPLPGTSPTSWCQGTTPPVCTLSPQTNSFTLDLSSATCPSNVSFTDVPGACSAFTTGVALYEECKCNSTASDPALTVVEDVDGSCTEAHCTLVEFKDNLELIAEFIALCPRATAVTAFTGTDVFPVDILELSTTEYCCGNTSLEFNQSNTIEFWISQICTGGFICAELERGVLITALLNCSNEVGVLDEPQDFCDEPFNCENLPLTTCSTNCSQLVIFGESVCDPALLAILNPKYEVRINGYPDTPPAQMCCAAGYQVNVTEWTQWPVVSATEPSFCDTVSCAVSMDNNTLEISLSDCNVDILFPPETDAYCEFVGFPDPDPEPTTALNCVEDSKLFPDPTRYYPLASSLCNVSVGAITGVLFPEFTDTTDTTICCEVPEAVIISDIVDWPLYDSDPNASAFCSDFVCEPGKQLGATDLILFGCKTSPVLFPPQDDVSAFCGTDFDACLLGLDDCNDSEECVNTETGFECLCPRIVPDNRCTDPHATCVTPFKSDDRACVCDEGLVPLYSSGVDKGGNPIYPPFRDVICTDVNECELIPGICTKDDPASDPGFEGASCINTFGSFECECLAPNILYNHRFECGDPVCQPCPYGTQYVGNNTCEDINECLHKPCDPVLGSCINYVIEPFDENIDDPFLLFNPFTCVCPPGYRDTVRSEFLDPSIQSHVCVDIDECSSFGYQSCLDQNNAVCVNYAGGFECVCPDPTVLVWTNTSTREFECVIPFNDACPSNVGDLNPCSGLAFTGAPLPACQDKYRNIDLDPTLDTNREIRCSCPDYNGQGMLTVNVEMPNFDFPALLPLIQAIPLCKQRCTLDIHCHSANDTSAFCQTAGFQQFCQCPYGFYFNPNTGTCDEFEICSSIGTQRELIRWVTQGVHFGKNVYLRILDDISHPYHTAMRDYLTSVSGLLHFGLPSHAFRLLTTDNAVANDILSCNSATKQLECNTDYAEPMCCNTERAYVGTFEPQIAGNFTAPRCLCDADASPQDALYDSFFSPTFGDLMTSEQLFFITQIIDTRKICDSCSTLTDPNCECVKTQATGLGDDIFGALPLYDVCSCAPIRRSIPFNQPSLLNVGGGNQYENILAESLVIWDGWMQGDGAGHCVDRNECEEEHWSSMCHPNATCHNLEYNGAIGQFIPFLCLCPEGMMGTGMGAAGCVPAVPCRGVCDEVGGDVTATCQRVTQTRYDNVTDTIQELNEEVCVCPTGYELVIDNAGGWQCVDIDECEVGVVAMDCDPLTAGPESCIVDACLTMTGTVDGDPDHVLCHNQPGTWSCECCAGFELVDASLGFTSVSGSVVIPQGDELAVGSTGMCKDIDECCVGAEENGTALCAEQGLSCINFFGSYACGCPLGTTVNNNVDYLAGTFSCLDINECLEQPNICGPHAECSNRDGAVERPGYVCDCVAGYEGVLNVTSTLVSDGSVLGSPSTAPNSCVDVDECTNGFAYCPMNATCVNLEGSVTCDCPNGTVPEPLSVIVVDGTNYVPENTAIPCVDCPVCLNGSSCFSDTRTAFTPWCECDENHFYNILEANGTCQPCSANPAFFVPGTFYNEMCLCPDGFERLVDGGACVDIDECSLSENPCDKIPGATCSNLIGGYECSVTECNGTLTCHEHATCVVNIVSLLESCVCNPGFVGDGVEYCVPCDLECGRANDLGQAVCDVTVTRNSTNHIVHISEPACTCDHDPTVVFDEESCQCVQRCDPPCLYADYCVLVNPFQPEGAVQCECPNGVGDGVTTCTQCCQDCSESKFTKNISATCEFYTASSACGITNPSLVNQEPHLLDSPTAVCTCEPGFAWCDAFEITDLGNADPNTVPGGTCPNLWYRTSPFGYGVAMSATNNGCFLKCGPGTALDPAAEDGPCVDIDECSLPLYDPSFAVVDVESAFKGPRPFPTNAQTCTNMMAYLLNSMPDNDCPGDAWIGGAEIDDLQAKFFARQTTTVSSCTNVNASAATTFNASQAFTITCPSTAEPMTLEAFEAVLDAAGIGMRNEQSGHLPPRCGLWQLYKELLEVAQCCMCPEDTMWDAEQEICRPLLPVCDQWNFDTGFGGVIAETSTFGFIEDETPVSRRLLSVHDQEVVRKMQVYTAKHLSGPQRQLLAVSSPLPQYLQNLLFTLESGVVRSHLLQSWRSDWWKTALIDVMVQSSESIFFLGAECYCPWQRTQPFLAIELDGMQNQICGVGEACMTVEQRTTCMHNECDDPNVDTQCEQTCIDLVEGYQCGCLEGYEVDPSNSSACVDIDECAIVPSVCGEANQVCSNLEGTFTCICEAGYAGTTGGLGGSLTCTECIAGTFSPLGNDPCVDCPPGKSSPKDPPYDSCEDCQAGSFASVAGQAECTLCPAGKFQAFFGATSCIDCPVGTNSTEGSTVCT